MQIKRPDFREVKYEREQLRILNQQLDTILLQEKRNIRSIGENCRKITNTLIFAELRKILICDLKMNYARLPLQSLQGHRIETLYDLLKYSRNQLERLSGIGEETADKLLLALRRATAEIQSKIHLRFDMENLSDLDKDLLHTIYRYLHAKELYKEAHQLYQDTHASITEALEKSEAIHGFWTWLFSFEKKKRSFLSAVNDVRVLNRSLYADMIRRLYERHDLIIHASFEDVLQDYKQNSVRYYTVIEDLADIRIYSEDAGDLEKDLLQGIKNYPLNLQGFRTELRKYQIFGVKYILHQKRVLLGDEMGLGKTIQALAAVHDLYRHGHMHFLIICPAVILLNWIREIEKFTDIPAYMFHDESFKDIERWKREGGIAVINYEGLEKLDFDRNDALDMVVVDEAHYVKNKSAKRTQLTACIVKQAEYALYMTGTAIENNVEEMCYLISCLQPGLAKEIVELQFMLKADVFKKKIAPIYLRRKRADVLMELPPLTIREEWCRLSCTDQLKYHASVQSGNFMAMRRVGWDSIMPSKAESMTELCMQALAEGRKVVVFSYFLDTLSFISDLLIGKALPVISGKLSLKERDDILNEFAQPVARVLPIQIVSGGVGLNIQTAEIVILCEPQLKPSTEVQAISRVYRMGQVNHVFVYRLLAADTIDEILVRRLQHKQDIFDQYADTSEVAEQLESAEKLDIMELIQAEREKINASK